MTIPGRLHFDADGKLRGAASIEYNDPFPTRNGDFGSGTMNGVLMHTMVGNLQPGTVAVFNEDRGADSASAHFGIAQDGLIWQFGPIGKGWIAWHAVAANATYYGIEHADGGDPDTPLTAAQVAASAQVLEALSAFAGFPLQEANAPGEKGYGTHFMGGAAYGGHTCPDLPPRHIRSQQRPAILALAAQIRAGSPPPPPASPKETEMILVSVNKAEVPEGATWPGVFLLDASGLRHVTSGADVDAYKTAGVAGPVTISWGEYEARNGSQDAEAL